MEIQSADSNQKDFKEHGNSRMMDVISDNTNPEKYVFNSR